jgi:acetyltransferase
MNQRATPNVLDAFMKPASIAIIGLSRSAIGSPVSIHTTLVDLGYPGRIHIVNPNMGAVPGASVCRTIPELPEPVDLAIISVERALVPGTLEACAARGIGAAIVITQGFADSDAVGAGLQAEMRAIVARTGMRIIGPNTVGVVNAAARFSSSFIEVAADDLPVGQVAQSGFLMMGHHLVTNEKAGFCMAVDLGNACDVSLADVLRHYEAEPAVSVIECHAEAIDDGVAFMDLARRITRQKPVVMLKAGRTEAGQAAVASHTGNVAGKARVAEAALRQSGVILAENAEELRLFSKSLATFGAMKGRRVGIMSFSGGGAVLAIDALDRAGLELATLSPATIARLKHLFPDWMEVTNPLDIWIPVARDLDTAFPLVMQALQDDEGVDAVLCIYCSYNLPKYARFDAAGHIRDLSAARRDKPVACWSYGQDIEGFTRRIEERRSAIVYPRLDDAARALAVLAGRAEQVARGAAAPAGGGPDLSAARRAAGAILDRAAAAGTGYLFTEAFEILEAYGLPPVPWTVVRDDDAADPPAAGLRAPLCLKIDSPDILHKSDVGGVALGLGGGEALAQGICALRATVARNVPGARIRGVVVQEMAARGTEVMIGMMRDPSFGPCIVFGTGGIHAEITDDFAFRVAPLSRQEAREMIAETRVARLLAGARGARPADLDALADALVRVSRIAADHPAIREIDLNPVFAGPDGLHLVDARFLLDGHGAA